MLMSRINFLLSKAGSASQELLPTELIELLVEDIRLQQLGGIVVVYDPNTEQFYWSRAMYPGLARCQDDIKAMDRHKGQCLVGLDHAVESLKLHNGDLASKRKHREQQRDRIKKKEPTPQTKDTTSRKSFEELLEECESREEVEAAALALWQKIQTKNKTHQGNDGSIKIPVM